MSRILRPHADRLEPAPGASAWASVRRWLVSRAAAAGLFVVALAPSLAYAQAQGRDTVPVQLEPLIVTVLRTPFELAEIPYAVAVTTREQIQRARPGLGVDEALRGIPGVQVDNRFNYALGERISIRGFGARSQFGVRGIRVLVDGIPATLPDGQTSLSHVDLGFLRRAEVIRGPASSLWGNAAGGVIQLETELPPSTPFSQEVGVVAGSDGLLRLHSTSGGQSGRASYLLNVARLRYSGFRDFNEAENLHLNARLGWQGERDELRLLGSFVDYDAQNPGSLSDSLLAVDRSQAFRFNRLQQTGEVGRQGQLGAVWLRTSEVGELEISGYGTVREIENPIPPAIIALERAAAGARALIRSRPGPLRWTVGAEGDLQRDDRRNFENEQGERGSLTLDQLERVGNLAGFGQLVWEPRPRWNVLAGLRYDRFRFRADDRLVTPGNPDDSGERDLDAWSPSLGLSYALADPLHLYANAATAFETPTTTELANRPGGAGGFNPELEPQRTLSYEIGAKGRWGMTTSYQLALYRARVEDALVPFQVPDAPGRDFFRNAGSALHRGLEAGVRVLPLRGLTLQAAYTFTDARFREYVIGDEVLDGNRIPGVAPHHLETLLAYEARAGGFVELEARAASRIPVNDENTAFSPAYTVMDARAGWDDVRLGRVELRPFLGVSNLLDTEYNTSVVVNAFGRRFYEPGPGRGLYAGAELRL